MGSRSTDKRNLGKKSYAAAGAAGVLLGLSMIIWQEKSAAVICCVLGVLLLLYGILCCVRFFFGSEGNDEPFRGGLADGALALGAGLFLVLRPARATDTFELIIGIVTLVDALFKLQFGLNMTRAGFPRGRAVLLLAAAAAVMGILMIVIENMAVALLGVFFLLNGLADLYTVYAADRFERERREMRKRQIDRMKEGQK